MAHIHNIYDTEPRYVIDPVTRSITCKSKVEEAVVQGDHNSERFAFEIPRFIDGHDMSLCNRVQVHYINTSQRQGSHSDIYPVDDLQIDPNDSQLVICSWLISNRATELDGALNFVLRFMCVTGETIDYAWSTVPYTGIKVLKGIVNYDEIIEDEYSSDLIEAWYNQLMSAGTDGVNIVEQAKNDALSEFDAHVDATRESFYNDIRENVANAIKKTVSGDIIQVDDVSPVEHTVNTYVHGKNLFDISKLSIMTGKVYISNIGSDYIEITSDADYDGNGYQMTGKRLRELCPQLRAGRTYTISANSEAEIKAIYLAAAQKIVPYGNSVTVTESMLDSVVCFYGHSSAGNNPLTGVCRISNIQIEEGTTATEYEPYIDPTTITVYGCGKNLMQPSGTKSQNGVTLTMNDNGVYTISGTTTAYINMNLGKAFLKAGYKYKPTIVVYSGSILPSFWSFERQENMYKDGDGYLSSDVDTEISSFIYASAAGTTYDAVFAVMLEVVNGSESGVYKPYKGSTFTPSEDGTCKVASVSPTMTIFADKDISIEATYNRDTTAVFDEINVLLETLLNGGVQT